ncbi:Serine/threonine-protein kinase PrkC [Streptomyces sp. YIM 130001]|uniref:serine/threonine-protein kinase n=1 Tax=Streptomyces sp. YIM 130001 TaxID=2259644 RepID=UPI000E65DD80|nr:serine/threonine-protein kinase [Streptomyces sp. YIM 130001]RII11240.1 Serine/threonine-protein kinase PrkC [Streptomyces sp. YIM 130001]
MGEVFAGRYELVDPIGHGGVGAVWRAWDHRRRRYVAAKVLQQSDAFALLRFVREQALRIDHPHVLAPASWAADDDKVLFTMDLVRGGSLAHVIGDYGPLPPSYVCVLLDQLLAGLTAVHAEGVVHRDIKPANILLEATGTGRPHLRLSDFGISMRKGEPRLTETNYVVGTPGYFAPEQLAGEEPDFPADLFAVGLVALYLLEGAKPDSQALVDHFADGTPSAPQGIPEPLWQVVATLLQPDPDARFRTSTGARKALTAAAELLPEPGPDDELVEIFDQLGPLPLGFGPDGPLPEDVSPDSGDPAPGPYDGPELPGPATPPADPPASPSEPSAAVRSDTSTPAPPAASAPAPDANTPPEQPSSSSLEAPRHPSTPSPTPGSAQPVPTPGAPEHQPGVPQPEPDPWPPAHPHTFTGGSDQSPAHPGAPHPQHHEQLQDTQYPEPSTPQYPEYSESSTPEHVPHHPPASPSPAPKPSPLPGEDPSQAPTTALRYENAPTRQYTAQQPQVPHPTAPISPAPAPAPAPAPTPPPAPTPASPPDPSPSSHRSRRPGPPAKVTIPVLLLAAACFAIGIWALTRI